MRFNFAVYLFQFILLGSLVSAFAQSSQPQDSLTEAICKNDEQIVAQRTSEWRIDYYMGETQLNMKTMCGFIELNSASRPLYNRYRIHKYAGWALFLGGIGLIIADGQISRPSAPVISAGGFVISIAGIYTGYKSNEIFRRAIRAYNMNICGADD